MRGTATGGGIFQGIYPAPLNNSKICLEAKTVWGVSRPTGSIVPPEEMLELSGGADICLEDAPPGCRARISPAPWPGLSVCSMTAQGETFGILHVRLPPHRPGAPRDLLSP